VARELLELGRFPRACFLAQQAAEKALKALVLAELRRYERSYDLTELYELVSRCLPLPGGYGEPLAHPLDLLPSGQVSECWPQAPLPGHRAAAG